MKLSSLFCLIEDLLAENHALVRDPKRGKLQLKTTNGLAYFLLTPAKTPVADLWEKGQNSLKEAPHIRFDSGYSAENTRLSPVHYTEIHQHPTDALIITIHIYFNERGHLETVAKQSNLENPDEYTPFPLSDAQKKALDYRVRAALPLFKDLVFEKSIRRLKAIEKAAQCEQQLSTLSRNLVDPSNRSQYREIAALFSQHIQWINRYDDRVVDRSDSIVNRFITMLDAEDSALELTSLTIEPKSSEPPENEDETTDQTLTAPTSESTLKEIEDVKTDYASETNTLLKELEPLLKKPTLSVQDILEISPMIENMKNKMLDLLFEKKDSSSITKQKKKSKKNNLALNKAQDAIDQYHAKKIALLNTCFLKGDLDAFTALFKLFSDNELLEAIKQWFKPMMQEGRHSYSKETIDILNFLEKNSEIYRSYIFKLERTLIGIPGKPKHYFFMVYLYFKDNLPLFEMFLDHGFDPNGLGQSGSKNKYLSLIKTLCLNMHPRTHLYLRKLLKMGALLDLSNADLEPYIDEKTRKELSSKFAPQNASKSLQEETEQVSKLPALLIAAKQCSDEPIPTFDSLQEMIPYAEPYALSIALAYLSSSTFFKRAITYNVGGLGISLYPSQESFSNAAAQKTPERNQFQILIYAITPLDSNNKVFRTMASLYTAFLRSDPNAIPNSMQKLDFLLQDASSFSENDFYVCYTAKVLFIAKQHSRTALTPLALETLFHTYHDIASHCPHNQVAALKTICTMADQLTVTLNQAAQRLLNEARTSLALLTQPAPNSTAPLTPHYRTTTSKNAKKPSPENVPGSTTSNHRQKKS